MWETTRSFSLTPYFLGICFSTVSFNNRFGQLALRS
jgi:hypothetical protein